MAVNVLRMNGRAQMKGGKASSDERGKTITEQVIKTRQTDRLKPSEDLNHT